MAEAEGLRKEESEEWAKTDADDAAAADVVQQVTVSTRSKAYRCMSVHGTKVETHQRHTNLGWIRSAMHQAASHQQPAVEFTADP
eukprot:3163857-Amphidinium_carterae.1